MNLKFIKTIILFWKTSISIEIEYRVNFFIEIISVLGNLLGSLFILNIFYSNGAKLGGWEWSESLVVLGVYLILEGFTIILLQPNLSRIVSNVQNGTLDFVLLKPLNSQIWLSLRMISPWGFPSLLLGIITIIYSLNLLAIKYTFIGVIFVILIISCSLLTLYSLWFIISTTSIWFVKVWNANEVLRSFVAAGRYPVNSYPDPIRMVLTFLLPIAFLTTIPAEAILQKTSLHWMLLSLLISLSLFFLCKRFWKFALSHYTSASS